MNDILMHKGVGHLDGGNSGRYPWGYGENPYQRGMDFMTMYNKYKSEGLSEKQIADMFDISTTTLRLRQSAASEAIKAERDAQIYRYADHGYSNVAIGKMMDIPDTTVGNVLKRRDLERKNSAFATADALAKLVDEKGYVDVGAGAELSLGITELKKQTAIELLKLSGYSVVTLKIQQATGKHPDQKTTFLVLGPPLKEGQTEKDIRRELFANPTLIKPVDIYSNDDGKTYNAFRYPESIDSSRVGVRYAEDGGTKRDGLIELRRGVDDISLGDDHYSQVRIAVDGTHYLKGMAIYSDDLPDGVDILVNSNKKRGTPLTSKDPKAKTVAKPMKDDPENPFGATIKAQGQSEWTDANGEKHLRVINKIKEEGDWEDYSKNLASQFLSKQPLKLIQQQLDIAYNDQALEFENIKKLTNPSIKEKMLLEFAESCDEAAESLKAAPLPGQTSKVLLPVSTLKDNEVYAPTFANGTEVVLIRYPHAGTFELPKLKVNNNHKDAQKIVGKDAMDAIGINEKTAQQLSGADFDGDSVVIIPLSSKVKIKTSPALDGLKDFDPKDAYPGYEGMKKMDKRTRGLEMGSVSNLITDMTLQNAPIEKIEKAVKHSMVVIDAEKHGLDWKRSEKEQGIKALKAEYQGGPNKGASTLISKAKSPEIIPEQKKFKYTIDPETGKKITFPTNRTYDKVKKSEDGSWVVIEKDIPATEKTTKMQKANDAFDLTSGTPQEAIYANYANAMKAMANAARKESLSVKPIPVDASAKKVYAAEIDSLNAKLNVALKNAPKERQAQLIARKSINEYKDLMGDALDKDDLKRKSQQAIASARAQVGARKKDVEIDISPNEWKAIQSGAISKSKLDDILKNTDMDKVKELAMPKQSKTLTQAQINLIKSMSKTYTIAEIAERLGVSPSTVSKKLKE